ncbi:MAG: glycosyltransferase [Cellvibrionaceae bacterium]
MGKDTQKNASQKARILCVWEMGGNLGHLTNLKLFVDRALSRGHSVSLAVRELHQVPAVFGELDIDVWQAPHLKLPSVNGKQPMVSYTDMVVQQGFGSEQQLQRLVDAWQNLYAAVKPDLVIYDHAPSALVASVAMPWKKWIVGSGFLIPRTDAEYLGVFPDVRRSRENGETLRLREQQAMAMINGVLRRQKLPEWETLKPWFEQCERQLLTTVPDVDHFGQRQGGDYLGVTSSVSGEAPIWLDSKAGQSDQPRVFVYANNFVGLSQLLEALLTRSRVLLYCKNLPNDIRQQFSERIAICDKPVSMQLLLQSGCFFVTNGNHNTAAQALLSGVPQLLIPLQREQYLLSVRVERAGRGVIAFPDDRDFHSSVERLLQIERVEHRSASWMNSARVDQRIDECFQECGL